MDIGVGNAVDIDEDLILLDSLIFTDLDAEGMLSFGAFQSNRTGAAQDLDDRVIYNTRDGMLYYDADGSGAGEAVQFARLSAGLDLEAANFYVI